MMMQIKDVLRRIGLITRRELRYFSRRPLLLFTIVLAPLICTVFFVSLMDKGLPTDLPAAIVDEDNTNITHIIVRTIDALEETNICRSYASFSEARQAMQRGEIYAFFYIPRGTTEEALANRQPRISFYTNEAFFVPGSLLMKDFRTASELCGLALTRETLYARGATEDHAMAVIQPIILETHPLNNSALDYSVYLSNMLVPGIIILLIMLATSYSIGMEWKNGTQRLLYRLSGESPTIALIGKLIPQTIVFTLIFVFVDVLFFEYLRFPCQCGLPTMILLGFVTVLASQAFGVFFFGVFLGKMRLAMCLCSLWGILSFSVAGFTYPVMAMSPIFQVLSSLFPLRHYYLIYVNQALNGYALSSVLPSIVMLMAFIVTPVLFMRRYRTAFLKYKYQK